MTNMFIQECQDKNAFKFLYILKYRLISSETFISLFFLTYIVGSGRMLYFSKRMKKPKTHGYL